MGYIDYHIIDNDIVKIIYSHKAGPRQVFETFYIKDTSLFFASKHATSYYFYGDSTVLLGKYYFEKSSLKFFSLYHDEEQNGFIKTQETILSEYNKVKSITLSLQKKKTGG